MSPPLIIRRVQELSSVSSLFVFCHVIALWNRDLLLEENNTKNSICIHDPADGNERPPRALPEGGDKRVFDPSHM